MKNNSIALLEALFSVVAWGASFIATKIALQDISPVTLVWLRFAIGVLILGIAVMIRRQFALPKPAEWGYFILLGFLGIAFFQWLQSKGLVTSRATTAAWIEAAIPVFMALLGWLGLKERLGWIRIGGILLATLGMLLVVSRGDLASLWVSGFGAPGDYLVLASAVIWAVFSILSRRGLKMYPAAHMMFYVMLLGWLICSVVFFSGPDWRQIPHLTRADWMGVAFLGIFCSGLAYIAWYDALQVLPAAQVGAFLYIEPVVTMLVAALVLDEKITLASLLGGGIILLGVWLVNRPGMTREDA